MKTRMRICAPVICAHPNYVGGDSVTMVFNHTYNMGECLGSDFLGQYLPWAISGAFGDRGQKKQKNRGIAFSLAF